MRPPQTLGAGGKPEFCSVEAGGDVHPIRRRLFRLVERIEADPTLPAPLKEATSKWRGLLARLSLVFHCIEIAEARQAGQQPDAFAMRALQAATVQRACNFIMRVVVPSTFRFHTEIGSTGISETHARWVAGYLLSRKLESITARDVGRAYREIRGNRAEIVATMDLLDHAGWVQQHPEQPTGYRVAGQSAHPRAVCEAGGGREGQARGCSGADPNEHRGAGPMRASQTSTEALVTFGTAEGRGSRAAAGFAGRRPKRHLRGRDTDNIRRPLSLSVSPWEHFPFVSRAQVTCGTPARHDPRCNGRSGTARGPTERWRASR